MSFTMTLEQKITMAQRQIAAIDTEILKERERLNESRRALAAMSERRDVLQMLLEELEGGAE